MIPIILAQKILDADHMDLVELLRTIKHEYPEVYELIIEKIEG